MRVIVVGGGIGGVATAVALKQQGLDPLVLEQAPALTEVGGGLVVAPNAKKVLNHLGAGELVETLGVRTEETLFYNLEGGDPLFRTRMGAVAPRLYGEHQYTMHRADLLDSLVRQLPAEHIRLDSRVAAVRQEPDAAVVVLETGEEITGDAVIGADGLRSRVRATLFGESEPTFTGVLGWRALIPADAAPHITPLPRNVVWSGAGRHVGFYPVRRGELLNLFAWVPAEEVGRESWLVSGDVADLRTSLAGACRELATIVDAVREAFITPLFIRPAMTTWSEGRITLLGDAAHPATAAAGQGAAMALEDAVALAFALGRCDSPADVPDALRDYEARRIPRTARMQSTSLGNLRWLNESDPVQRAARNGRFLGMQRLDPLGSTPWRFLFCHDPVEAARRPLDEVLGAQALPNDRRRPAARAAFDAYRSAIGVDDRAALWRGEREAYARFLGRIGTVPAGTEVAKADADGVPVLLVGGGAGPTVFHLHGGGYTSGSADDALAFAARLAEASGGRVVVPDYRLAPEHPFPAALDDAVAAYRWLAGRPGLSAEVIVTGEDAGGGLAVGMLAALRDAGEALPSRVHLYSPFADLTLGSPAIDEASGHDAWWNRDLLGLAGAAYFQDHDPADPRVSTVAADLSGFPPVHVYTASDEALAGDARRLAAAAGAAGVLAELVTEDDSVHSYVLFADLPESARALERISHPKGDT